MNTAESIAELFDSVCDVVHAAGGTEHVVFLPVAATLLPQLIEGLEPKHLYLQHHGTPGVYELVVDTGERTIDAAPRPRAEPTSDA